MKRLESYLGILAALLLAAFVVAFSNGTAVERVPSAATPSDLSVLQDFTPPKLTFPNFIQEPAPEVPTPPPKSNPLDASAVALREALVNIICYVPAGSGLRSMSGSGVTIDPKGVILTNAHIAQYFLLADRGVSCIVRAGSPAVNRYHASLVYISPAWLKANPSVLTEESPVGTGEYDFALLAVTSPASGSSALPSPFPHVPLAAVAPSSGTPIVIATYGAQSLGSDQIQSSLFPTIVFGSVKGVFTFGVNTVDVLALGGSAAAQEGSSGGGVADSSGELVGTLTTSSAEGDASARTLNAITAPYIRSEYERETGQPLDLLLAKSPSAAATDFAPRMPALESIITAHLP